MSDMLGKFGFLIFMALATLLVASIFTMHTEGEKRSDAGEYGTRVKGEVVRKEAIEGTTVDPTVTMYGSSQVTIVPVTSKEIDYVVTIKANGGDYKEYVSDDRFNELKEGEIIDVTIHDGELYFTDELK